MSSPTLDCPAQCVKVNPAQERAFRFARHGLLGEAQPTPSVESLASDLFGLHAARQSSPWVALRARIPGFEPSELRRMLSAERRLIKVRCMRQTLHILPTDLASTAHHATLRQRLGPCLVRLRHLDRTERALSDAASRVRSAVAEKPVPYRELQLQTSGGSKEQLALLRLAIKWLWETGELVHVDLSPSLHHEHRAFALTESLYPGLELRPDTREVQKACDALVLHHIRAFGPTSITDTGWWSGLGTAAVRRALERHAGEFVTVRLGGASEDLLLAEQDLERLLDTAPLDPEHVTLLAHEDPALKGYFSTRGRYVRSKDYKQLFNSIGEARASIMLGGEAIGIWGYERNRGRVAFQLMRQVSKRTREAISDRLDDMETFLRAEPLLAGAQPG
jgi:Winged helix DNA-binding domain